MKLLRLTLALLAVLIGSHGHAQTPSSKAAPYRFLILVDTSTNMRKLEEMTPTVLYDMIEDGMFGRMQPGDVYSVWTFSDTVDTSFTAPLVWRPELSHSQAQAIDLQYRRIKSSGKAKLDEVMRTLNPLISHSDDLNIFIIHDGSGVMFGTPFDLQVTSIYRQFYKDMNKNGRPFVTSFAVQKKKIVAWAVDAAGGNPTLPNYPRKSDKPPTTNTVAKATKPTMPTPEAPPKKPAPEPIIVKGPLKKPEPTNAPPKVAVKPMVAPAPTIEAPPVATPPKATPTPPSEPKPELTQTTAPKVEVAVVNEAPKPATMVVTSAPSAVSLPSPTPRANLTEPSAAIAASHPDETIKPSDIVPMKFAPEPAVVKPVEAPVAKTTVPEPKTAAANPVPETVSKTVDTAAELAQTAVVVPPTGGPDWVKLSLGVACFIAAIAAIFFLTRRAQPAAHGSVISRSMNKD